MVIRSGSRCIGGPVDLEGVKESSGEFGEFGEFGGHNTYLCLVYLRFARAAADREPRRVASLRPQLHVQSGRQPADRGGSSAAAGRPGRGTPVLWRDDRSQPTVFAGIHVRSLTVVARGGEKRFDIDDIRDGTQRLPEVLDVRPGLRRGCFV